MADLARVPAGQERPAVADEGCGDAGADGDEQDVGRPAGGPHRALGDAARADVVAQGDGQAGPFLQQGGEREVVPAEVDRPDGDLAGVVHDAGDGHPCVVHRQTGLRGRAVQGEQGVRDGVEHGGRPVGARSVSVHGVQRAHAVVENGALHPGAADVECDHATGRTVVGRGVRRGSGRE